MMRREVFWRKVHVHGQDAVTMRSRPPMKHISPRLSFGFLTLALIGSACNQTSAAKYDAGVTMFDVATINVMPTVATFPNTSVGMDSSAQKFTLGNIGFEATGPLSLLIDGPNSGEFIITSSTCAQPLAYMNTCEVSVIFRPQTQGPKSARLNASATPGGSFQVMMNATSQSPAAATVTPMIGSFMPVPIAPPNSGVAPTFQMIPFTVTNTGGTPVSLSSTITGADMADFMSSDGCTGSPVQPTQTCTITVFFAPTDAGVKTASLNISGDAVKLSVPLSGSATMPATLVLAPTMQDFGSVPFGMTSVQQFTVTNNGGQASSKPAVNLVGASSAGFAITTNTCTDVLNPGDICTILVTFSPTIQSGAGAKTASLSVLATAGGNLTAALTGTATTAVMQGMLALTSVAGADPFGSVSVGGSATAFFSVQNTGAVPAGKVTATLAGSGNEFTVSNNGCPDMLGIMETCLVQVTFTPVLQGRRTATLQAIANPGGFATLPLSGNATAGALLSVTPNFLSFGNHRIGTNTTATPTTFTVRNIGSDVSGPLMVTLEGTGMNDFQIVATDCNNTVLQPRGNSCTVRIRFVPTTALIAPPRSNSVLADLGIAATPGGVVRATLTGVSCAQTGGTCP